MNQTKITPVILILLIVLLSFMSSFYMEQSKKVSLLERMQVCEQKQTSSKDTDPDIDFVRENKNKKEII
jgi:hypothetical protein